MLYRNNMYEEISEINIEKVIQDFNIYNLIIFKDKNRYYDPEKQIYGDVLSLLIQECGLSLEKALLYLHDKYKLDISKQDEKPIDYSELYEINKAAMEFYQKQLSGKALGYIKERGVSDYYIKKFKLGYAGEFGDELFSYLIQNGYKEMDIRTCGLINESKRGKIYDRFWDRIMFPILDEKNRVIGFGGRTTGGDNAKYINSIETPIFDKSRTLYGVSIAKKSTQKFLIVCEGYMDVIAFHRHGFNNAVASLGTALTREHVRKLKKYVDTVYLAYDCDLPGRKAAVRATELIESEGMNVKIIDLQPWKDPDEFAKNEGRNLLKERIDNALENRKWEMKASILNPVSEDYFDRIIDILGNYEETQLSHV